jgi:hypothetical protein
MMRTWNCFLFLMWRRVLGKEQYSETTSTMPILLSLDLSLDFREEQFKKCSLDWRSSSVPGLGGCAVCCVR